MYSGSPRNKPVPGVEILRDHPLCPASANHPSVPGTAAGFGLCCPMNEGAGRPFDLIRHMAGSPLSGTLSGAAWNAKPAPSRWGGPVVSFTSTTDGVDFGDCSRMLRLDEASIVLGYRKRDGTHRGSTAFVVDTATSTQFAHAAIPNSDGTVYWDWGGTSAGTSRISVAGLTFGDDVWVFTVGPRGMDIWQNGILRASQSGHASRTGSTNSFKLGANGAGLFGGGADLADIAFIYIYQRQLNPSECVQISENPFVFFKRQPMVVAQAAGGGGGGSAGRTQVIIIG